MRQDSEECACLHSSAMIKLASVSIFHTYSLATKIRWLQLNQSQLSSWVYWI